MFKCVHNNVLVLAAKEKLRQSQRLRSNLLDKFCIELLRKLFHNLTKLYFQWNLELIYTQTLTTFIRLKILLTCINLCMFTLISICIVACFQLVFFNIHCNTNALQSNFGNCRYGCFT